MEPVRIRDILGWTGGTLESGTQDLEVSSISIDSRRDCRGALFVPLKGDNFDGHDFIKEAVARGATAVLHESSRGMGDLPDSVTCVGVEGTLRAFQNLAAGYRRQFKLRVIAVTGSNGKTTTKEFIRSIAATGFRTVATEGTRNNHVGVPQSLLELDSSTEVGVFEMGMSGKGEITRLGAIADPDIGVITNISPVHTEFFKSVKDVALAKGELLASLDENDLAVLNTDDDWYSLLLSLLRSRVLTFGMTHTADVVSGPVHPSAEGLAFDVTASGRQCRCRINAYGKHNAYNALAAITAGIELGIELETACSALAGASLPEMRFQFDDVAGIMLINDAYNANPISTIAALDALDQLKTEGRLIAVLGDMLELGWYSSEGHREVGQRVARSKVDVLVTVGDLASEIAVEAAAEGFTGEVERVTSASEAAGLLREFLTAGDTLFIKGSRAVRLEQVIELIKKDKLTERP